MKIGILSFRSLNAKASKEELRILKDAREKGHTVRIFRSQRFQMVYAEKQPWLLYDGKPLPKYDIFIIRPSILSNASLYISLVEQMAMTGILLFNRHDAILKTKNKIKTMQILNNYGIPIPKTVIVKNGNDVAQAAKIVGGFPLIVKEPFGSFGNGVTIIESMRALKSFLRWDKPMYLFQEYVKHSKGKDFRIFVINGHVVGSMMRSAKKGEFRSNIELGGKGGPADITEEESAIAVRCVQALDLHYGGVDLMRGKDGPVVLEVNSNPGFKALEESTGANIAGAIVDYAVDFAVQHQKQTSLK
ncbi:RimK family alpha-L-glutamate ligase [Patescibacteria group bacterium]|nr:RimK family alpha-L-glutamate ligase [Patescibacteria group bacterium]